MILCLCTSSLVKLYFEEPFSDLVEEWVNEAEIVTTCRIAFTETIAALDIRFKRHDISKRDYALFVKKFIADWEEFAVIDFDEVETGHLIKKYGLRRLDAIHLSSAKIIKNWYKTSLSFSSFDKNLCNAAAVEGFNVLTGS